MRVAVETGEMMGEVRLYDSTICRLCAEDNGNGELLYVGEGSEADLSSMVNRYLPLKVRDDGKLPRTICPGCNIQLEATVQFFELLVDGQKKIREMWKQQVERKRKAERERLREQEKERVDADHIDTSYDDQEDFDQQIIIKIMPDGSMYAAEHEMSLQMEGLSKPKRKRGRPPKNHSENASLEHPIKDQAEGSQGEEEKQEDEVEEVDGDGRRRRKRKVPKRYMEAVQGKELERIFKEEGVIDEEDLDDSDNYHDSEEHLNLSIQDGQEEIIGHLESEEGKDLGELVIVNRGRGRGRPKLRRKKNKFTCQLCGRGFLQRSRYIVHKSFHKGIKYECMDCKKLFTSRENILFHQRTTGHSGDREVLDRTSDGSSMLENRDEQPTSSGEQSMPDLLASFEEDAKKPEPSNENPEEIGDPSVYNCEHCEKQFRTEQTYQLHLKVAHDKDKCLACNVCGRRFAHPNNLKAHMLMHQGNKPEKEYPCDVCGKVLNHPSSVVYHKEAEHNNGRRFVCNKCGKSFKHKQLLQRHQLVHSDDRPYVCKSCNASFKTKANLINHQSTHTGEKKYFCEICGQQFAHKTSLTLHYRWHTGHKPYTCEVCQKSFSQNGNLQEHMRIHTGEKPYCCDYCGRKFTTSSQFKLHVKRHTGERPWKCEFCAKSFLHKDTWKCHVRRHKGERPFQCAHCNRGFTEQWALKKHLRLHTGEKPYSCEVCGKAFADCSNLTKHKKVHREARISSIGEGDPIGEVWQILPGSQEPDEHSLAGQMTQVITTDDASGDGIQQIIYVSYQDPDDPNQSRTLHFVDAGMMRNKQQEKAAAASQALAHLNIEGNQILAEPAHTAQANSGGRMNMELTESDLQLQITDEEGNPIPLSIQDARQLLSQSQFVNQLNDGQEIRVHPATMSEDLASSLTVQVAQNGQMKGVSIGGAEENKAKTISTVQSDAEAIVKALEDESTEARAVAAMNQLNEAERQAQHRQQQQQQRQQQHSDIGGTEQAIEFTTQDGQKVRLVTSYHVDPMQLASEYLTVG